MQCNLGGHLGLFKFCLFKVGGKGEGMRRRGKEGKEGVGLSCKRKEGEGPI